MSPQSKQTAPAGRSSSGARIGLVAGAVGLALFVAVLVGLRLAGSDDGAETSAGTEPGVEHVHGLGINPADGSLVVATHYGSFRLPADGGEAERIGESFQDTMGFTVAGPDHFLGSGHPDVAGMREGQPSRLGLIESTDAGATWTALSLNGEVDFHGLAFAHGQVYGWDSGTGRFMVLSDKQEWETRSSLDLFGFAVDPDDADNVMGTGPDGLIESSDGGRSWRPAEGPGLVALSWNAEAGLWGTDRDGGVWRRSSATWERAGSLPGQAQAFLATPEGLYAAAHDAQGRTGIYQSTDQGATWELRYRDPAQ